MKYTQFISILKSFKDSNVSEPMVSLGNSHELPALVRGLGWRIAYAVFPRTVKVTRRLKQLQTFTRYILIMSKRHGSSTTVKYLKSSTLAIQKYIAGSPVSSLREIEPTLMLPRLANGLPRFISIEDRRSIRRGNIEVIQWWLTLFSIYRVIRIPGTLKLSTITEDTSASEYGLQMGSNKLSYVIGKFIDRFDFSIFDKEVWLLPNEKASPHMRVSWGSWFVTPLIMRLHYPQMYSNFLEYMGESWSNARFKAYYTMCSNLQVDSIPPALPLGKLSCKEEAAGKVRVFAMVDIWTQSMLKPLHDFIFKFLKNLPNDGTFDQNLSVLRAKEKAARFGQSFGYDLSAATDRLPISLQIRILSDLIGSKKAELWGKILVDRDYILSSDEHLGKGVTKSLRYKVGQPMGALSSWGMLALTHHMIVQACYREVYPLTPVTWYSEYELLGDDIVLFDEKVAHAYLQFMDMIGVGINLSKSVISNNGSFEFAKVSSYKGKTVSAIPWKMFISQRTRMGRVNILLYLLRTKEIAHPIRYVKNLSMFRPGMQGDYGFTLIALLTMLTTSSAGKGLSWEELLRTLGSASIASNNYIKNLLNSQNITYLEYLITSLLKGKGENEIVYSKKPLVDMSFTMDHPFQKISVANYLLTQKGKVTRFQGRDQLTNSIVDAFLPALPKEARKLQWPQGRTPESLIWPSRLFASVYWTVNHWFHGYDELWEKIRPGIAHLPIADLLQMKEKWDSFKEVERLLDRFYAKMDGDTGSKLKRTESLKALQFLVDANKDRPLWTYDIERMSHLRYMRISRNSFDW